MDLFYLGWRFFCRLQVWDTKREVQAAAKHALLAACACIGNPDIEPMVSFYFFLFLFFCKWCLALLCVYVGFAVLFWWCSLVCFDVFLVQTSSDFFGCVLQQYRPEYMALNLSRLIFWVFADGWMKCFVWYAFGVSFAFAAWIAERTENEKSGRERERNGEPGSDDFIAFVPWLEDFIFADLYFCHCRIFFLFCTSIFCTALPAIRLFCT